MSQLRWNSIEDVHASRPLPRFLTACAVGLGLLLVSCGDGTDLPPAEAGGPSPALPDPVEASVPKPENILSTSLPPAQESARLLAKLPVGRNPQQIAFSQDGGTAYVAAARSNRVTVVDARNFLISGSLEAPGIPFGVGVVPETGDILVSSFKGGRIDRLDRKTGKSLASLKTGEGSSLLVGPLPNGTFLMVVEREKRMVVVDGKSLQMVASFPTGEKPFPPAVTSDGRFAFVPSYIGGTVAFVDLEKKMLQTLVRVGTTPSAGAVLPGDEFLAIPLREENRLTILDIKSRKEVRSVTEGIGLHPFSIVISPDQRLAFVNNTLSADISVLRLPDLSFVELVKVGKTPSAIAVHPSGTSLWVSCEGDHQLYILEIPERWGS